jgi:ribonuclease HII
MATSTEIDQVNILQATFIAMRRAIENLSLPPDYILVDGHQRIPGLEFPQETIVGGDGKVLSIAASSILAKVYRDNLMREYHLQYPVYGFDRHKGYPTEEHRLMIRKHGMVQIHRKSFDLLGRQLEMMIDTAGKRGEPSGETY